MARLPPASRGKPLDWGDDEAATRVQRDAAALSLIAREGPAVGEVFGSDGDAITIGRGSSCAIRLALSEISRRHATVRYHSGRYWVEDLGTLNGTKVNDHLIDGPTALRQGDRIRVGSQTFEVSFAVAANRRLVYDGPNSEAVSVTSTSPSTSSHHVRGPVRAPLGPLGFAAVCVLAVAVGVLFAFVITRQSRRNNSSAVAARPAPIVAAGPAAAAPPPVAAPLQSRIELDDVVTMTARDAGVVQRAAARGTPVRGGDEVARLRRNNVAQQRELDRLNEQLEDDDSNPELVRRAHALAEQLAEDDGTTTLRSDCDGVVVASPATGARPKTGVAEVRVARRVRLVVDAGAIHGAGSACRVVFLDQRLDGEGRRVVGGGAGATIELTRFSEKLSFQAVGRVRADCQ